MRKFVKIALIVTVFCAIFALAVSAADPTLQGQCTKEFNGQKIVDTNWYYYDDTKTLEFVGNTTAYNETGGLDYCGYLKPTWLQYKDVIEHVIIGENINKITGYTFKDHTALKDVRIESKVMQIDAYAFTGCTNFTTLWVNGKERIEGRFDGSGLIYLGDAFGGSSVKEVVLSDKLTYKFFEFPETLETIYTHSVNEVLRRSCLDFGVKLINAKTNEAIDLTQTNYVNPYVPEGAKISGISKRVSNGATVVSVKWAYYDDTKTLELIGDATGENMSGDWKDCVPEGDNWARYIKQIEHLIIGPNITKIPSNAFKGYINLIDVRIEKNLTEIEANAFSECSRLQTLWVNGTEYVEGRAALTTITKYNNSFPHSIFKEVYLGEQITDYVLVFPDGTKSIITFKVTDELIELAKKFKYKIYNGSDMSEVDTSIDYLAMFPGATVAGHNSFKFQYQMITDTYWAYYQDTKTLEFVTFVPAGTYNECGAPHQADSGTTWAPYINEIEHVIIGDGINKITSTAFNNCKALIDVRLGKNVNQIDASAFGGCKSLTTIWRDGTERIEGRADFSNIAKFSNIISGTAIREMVLHEKVETVQDFLPDTMERVYTPNITEAFKADAKRNYFDLINLNDENEAYRYFVPIDTSLPFCGARAVFEFDEATGTLTIYGSRGIDDVINYYGGGSKTSPFFGIKKKVKHVIIADTINEIGKYAFCQFANLESVALPNLEGLIISNAAFEKCTNLRTIYINGNEPIEGTADFSKVGEIRAWAFSEDTCFANIILPEAEVEVAKTAFDSNVNLANVYGVPGSFAEAYATKNGLTFLDSGANTPAPVHIDPPETETETESETLDTSFETVTETETETEFKVVFNDTKTNTSGGSGASTTVIIIAAVAAAVVIAVAAVVVIIMKKKKK